MNRSGTVLLFVLAAAIAGTAGPIIADGARCETLQGDWEMVIASPRRPWNLLVHLRQEASVWTGRLQIEGLAEFALENVRVDSSFVRFRFPPELDSIPFEGIRVDGRIVGHVVEDGQRIPARLTRFVPLPLPANRIESWRQDLEFARVRLLAYDRSFTPRARERFRDAIARLERSLARTDDAEVLANLAKAVGVAGNAHTRLRLDPTRGGTFGTELPIRIWWFHDGPYVIRSTAAYRRALGCRVVAIQGLDPLRARKRVEGAFAGNRSWKTYLAPIYLTNPDMLHGLGLTSSPDGARFTFEDPQGERLDLWVSANPVNPESRAAESWQELSPLVPAERSGGTTPVRAPPGGPPLYLRHPEQPYWFEFLPTSGVLYFQFNRAENAEEGPAFPAFADSLMGRIRTDEVRSVVVDLRFNSGGDLNVARAFMVDLAREPKLRPRGRLFVIVGRCTFSAGLYHAAQLKQLARATFVGEPVGDRLDYWAEGGEIILPNSSAVIAYSNGFHRYSTIEYPGYRPYYEALAVPRLAPDLVTPLSSSDYFAGRDPALEAILARIADLRR